MHTYVLNTHKYRAIIQFYKRINDIFFLREKKSIPNVGLANTKLLFTCVCFLISCIALCIQRYYFKIKIKNGIFL